MLFQRILKCHLLISNCCSQKGLFPKENVHISNEHDGFFSKARLLQSPLQTSFSLDPLNYKLFEIRECPDHLCNFHCMYILGNAGLNEIECGCNLTWLFLADILRICLNIPM